MTNTEKPYGQTFTTPSSGTGVESLTAPVDFLGPSGKYVELHLLARVKDDTRNDEDRRNDLTLRKFKVSAILGKSNIFSDGQLPIVAANNGDSFLVGPSDFSNLEVNLGNRIYVFHKNSAGEYSYVELECDAISYKQAHHFFYEGLTSYLDTLAYRGKCSVFIQAVRIEDVPNQIIVLPQVSPYRKQEVYLGDLVTHPELRPIYALYREGKNASSNFYRFLCFFKILEGIFGMVRPKLFKRAKSLQVEINRESKRIPNDPHLIPDHQKHVGKAIQSFFESVLTPEFRHGVAHFMLDDGAIMNLSAPEQIEKYTHIVYITELCIREMIDECEKILVQLAASTSQKHIK
jgi:hypothetical protein